MDGIWIDLKEAAAALKRSESGLRAMCNHGELGKDARQVPWGARLKWQVSQTYIDAHKGQDASGEYKRLVERWKAEQLNVYKLKPQTVERNYYGLRSFWRYLANDPLGWEYKEDQDLSLFTIQNIRQAMANTAKIQNIYMGSMSFFKFLIREGLRLETDLLRFKDFKPSKNKNPKRTFLKDEDAFAKLLDVNQHWTDGRTRYDIELTATVLQLGYYTGMRNQEMCNLKLEDVDLKRGTILVFKGKGDKTRKVGICPELEAVIRHYLTKRPKTGSPYFLVQATGGQMNRRTIWRRIKNLGEKAGIPIKPHGLRNTFITKLLLEGVPSVKVQKIVGHEHLETTELYDMSSDEDALDVLRGPRQPVVKPKRNPEFLLPKPLGKSRW